MVTNQKFSVNYYLTTSDSNSNELLILEPDTDTVTGDILFFHGHQVGVRVGAWETPRYLLHLLSKGYRVIVPSILGYGKTTGEADYCGPDTLKRVVDTVSDFVKDPIHIMGASRGASLAILFAEYFPELTRSCTAIAGTYDLESMVIDTSDERMKRNILSETGGTADAYKVRDPKTHWRKLAAPLHIVHGLKDEQIPVTQAEMFVEFLQSNGRDPKLSILETASHKLFSEQTFNEVIIPFLEEV
jgi:dipeptidyl aminopeptidase/acylaminoacyl peptidase